MPGESDVEVQRAEPAIAMPRDRERRDHGGAGTAVRVLVAAAPPPAGHARALRLAMVARFARSAAAVGLGSDHR